MQRGFTKLFSNIVTSTIWAEDDKTRIVFVTMLAIADAQGEVSGSIPGLANLARVDLDACERALAKLEGPDPYSRTKTDEGRRIRPVDGGWQIINYAKYRGMLSAEDRREYKRIKQREYRQREMSTVSTSGQNGHKQRQKAEAEASGITPDGVVDPASTVDGLFALQKNGGTRVTPYDEIFNLWREVCPAFRQPKTKTDTLRDAVRRLWGHEKLDHDLGNVRELFEYVSQSDFLRSWGKCTLDWVCKKANTDKILAGNYDNDEGVRR